MTLRLRPGLPSLRAPRLVRAFEHSLTRAAARPDFRIIHYSLQATHAHLVVEATAPRALGRGMKALGTRLARAVHRAFGWRGPGLAERYHLRVLRTSRWFDGWATAAPIPPGPRPVARARTWLLRVGWRRHGPISPDDVPGPRTRRTPRCPRPSPPS